MAAPKIRRVLGFPAGFSVGLSAHDFASALGAPRVLITRARRDSSRQRLHRGWWFG